MKWLPTDDFYNPYSISFDFKISAEEERDSIENLLSQIGFNITEEIVKDFAFLTNEMSTFIQESCKVEINDFLRYAKDKGITMGVIPPDIVLAKYTVQYLLIAAAKFIAGIVISEIIKWLIERKKKANQEDTEILKITEKVLSKLRKEKDTTKMIITKLEKYTIEFEESKED